MRTNHRPGWSRLRGLALPLLLAALGLAASPGAAGATGVVVADDPTAAEVGADILEAGGNAVDAAVATAFALAVTLPQAGNLGGGGFLLFRTPEGLSWVIDFREKAPATATRGMFLRQDGTPDPERSRAGPLSVGVPGSVAGLLLAHRRFGTLPLPILLAPASRLAAEGFPVPAGLAAVLKRHQERLRSHPYTESVFTNDGRPLRRGEILVQTDLAATLERISEHGEAGFYRGETARALVEGIRALGGSMSEQDLLAYRPEERAPLRGSYRGLEVLTVPPPSAGGVTLLQMLHILEGYDLTASGRSTPDTLHRMAAAMQVSFADRYRYLGDPAFVSVPVARLTSPAYAGQVRGAIPAGRAIPASQLGEPGAPHPESSETTHLSALDPQGGAVALTTTLNSSFGSGIALEGLGFLLNNEMDDFSTAPGHPNLYGLVEGEANSVAPGKRMVSSMCPTIVLSDGVPLLVLGSPGGPQIPTAVLQVIVEFVDFGRTMEEAVEAPRIHHQWLPDALQLEAEGRALPADVVDSLRGMGYTFLPREAIGSILVAGWDRSAGEVRAAADPRRYGAAAYARPAPVGAALPGLPGLR